MMVSKLTGPATSAYAPAASSVARGFGVVLVPCHRTATAGAVSSSMFARYWPDGVTVKNTEFGVQPDAIAPLSLNGNMIGLVWPNLTVRATFSNTGRSAVMGARLVLGVNASSNAHAPGAYCQASMDQSGVFSQ